MRYDVESDLVTAIVRHSVATRGTYLGMHVFHGAERRSVFDDSPHARLKWKLVDRAELYSRSPGECKKRFDLASLRGDRLLADDVHARAQRRLAGREVVARWRADVECIDKSGCRDAVGSNRLAGSSDRLRQLPAAFRIGISNRDDRRTGPLRSFSVHAAHEASADHSGSHGTVRQVVTRRWRSACLSRPRCSTLRSHEAPPARLRLLPAAGRPSRMPAASARGQVS